LGKSVLRGKAKLQEKKNTISTVILPAPDMDGVADGRIIIAVPGGGMNHTGGIIHPIRVLHSMEKNRNLPKRSHTNVAVVGRRTKRKVVVSKEKKVELKAHLPTLLRPSKKIRTRVMKDAGGGNNE